MQKFIMNGKFTKFLKKTSILEKPTKNSLEQEPSLAVPTIISFSEKLSTSEKASIWCQLQQGNLRVF